MCDVNSGTVTAWASLLSAFTAIIAVVFGSVLQWKISRRQAVDNISAKRQVWIDELRSDFSKYIQLMAHLEDLRRPNTNISIEDQRANFDDMAISNNLAYELAIRIKLRLNPNEESHLVLMECIGLLMRICKDPPINETHEQRLISQNEFNFARDNCISQMQKILKGEWERIKRGT